MKKFLTCGVMGWCLEIFWTSLGALRKRQMKLMGTTSAWMFPIYGCAALLSPVSRLIRRFPAILRGSIYSFLILAGEFLSGSLLSRHGLCPWDYSRARFHYKGLIRPDYFFLWFFVGLLYEKILTRLRKS